jgi:hypothetical protein
MSNDFIGGLFVKNPGENAPDFVKGSLSIMVDKFIPYLKSKANAKGYVNIDLLESKDGNLYAKFNEWKPSGERAKPEPVEHDMAEDEEINIENLPF